MTNPSRNCQSNRFAVSLKFQKTNSTVVYLKVYYAFRLLQEVLNIPGSPRNRLSNFPRKRVPRERGGTTKQKIQQSRKSRCIFHFNFNCHAVPLFQPCFGADKTAATLEPSLATAGTVPGSVNATLWPRRGRFSLSGEGMRVSYYFQLIAARSFPGQPGLRRLTFEINIIFLLPCSPCPRNRDRRTFSAVLRCARRSRCAAAPRAREKGRYRVLAPHFSATRQEFRSSTLHASPDARTP